MLSVSNLDIQYGEKHLFKSVSAAVYPQDRIGLVGVNGAGKSTLMKIMAGETSSDDGVVSCAKHFSVSYLPQESSEVLSEGTLYNQAEGAFSELLALQQESEMLNNQLNELGPQDPKVALLLERLGSIQHRLEDSDIYSIRSKTEKVLMGLGFSRDDFNRPVSTFSGGWVMRLLLARMLLSCPSLLLLDEPTNHLDLESLTWVENYLQSHKGALVIISHDRTFLDRITTKTWELSLGRLTSYKGNYSRYLIEKEERRQIEKAAYDNQQAQIRQTMRFVERFKAKSTKARQAQSKLKQLDRLEKIELREDEHQVRFTFPTAPRSGRDVLKVKSLGKSYDQNQVFSGVDFLLNRGDKVAVVGNNGAGKSTLMKLLADKITLDEGSITYGTGVLPTYFGQHQAQELPANYSVLETLSHSGADMTVTQMRSLLGAFLFRGEDVDKKVSVLSGGEKSRLALAKMIATPANCMILDEPTNHLDMKSQEVLQEAMNQYDGTIIVVSHNRYFLDCFVNKVLEVKDGQVTEFLGNISEYIHQKENRAEQQETQTGIVAYPEPSPERENDSSRENRKEQRRLEARKRAERQEKAGKWITRVSESEKKIEALEILKEELEATMADPELYQDQKAFSEASKEYDDCCRRLDRWIDRWEEAQQKVDEIDQELADR